MAVVEYKVPGTLAEAVGFLSGSKLPVRVLAGGTDLIIQSRAQSNPVMVVDIKHIAGMCDAVLDDNGLTLGPSMSCVAFTSHADIKLLYPGLVEAAYLIGSTQVQGRASIGGNLCNASPAADTIPALIAVSAQCVIQGPAGERSVPVEDFVVGVGKNCMTQGELLQAIRIAKPLPRTADAYLRFIPRTEMDIAVAGAGVSITLDEAGICTDARVAIGAVAPTALLVASAADALIGTKIDETALRNAASAASNASKPITDRRGTIEYRRHVVGVLTRRAAEIAAARAKEK